MAIERRWLSGAGDTSRSSMCWATGLGPACTPQEALSCSGMAAAEKRSSFRLPTKSVWMLVLCGTALAHPHHLCFVSGQVEHDEPLFWNLLMQVLAQ